MRKVGTIHDFPYVFMYYCKYVLCRLQLTVFRWGRIYTYRQSCIVCAAPAKLMCICAGAHVDTKIWILLFLLFVVSCCCRHQHPYVIFSTLLRFGQGLQKKNSLHISINLLSSIIALRPKSFLLSFCHFLWHPCWCMLAQVFLRVLRSTLAFLIRSCSNI